MVALLSLWLPILVSAVLVFIGSSVLHMVLRHHQHDHSKVDREAEVMEALGKFAIPPGDYFMPRPASMKDIRTAEFREKQKRGPIVLMTVYPNGQMSMVPSLVQWFIYSLVVSVFAGYVAGRALGPGAPYLAVYRFAGVTSFAGYGLALFQDSIWYRRKWSTTAKYAFDGLIYAGLTAGTFGAFWPK